MLCMPGLRGSILDNIYVYVDQKIKAQELMNYSVQKQLYITSRLCLQIRFQLHHLPAQQPLTELVDYNWSFKLPAPQQTHYAPSP